MAPFAAVSAGCPSPPALSGAPQWFAVVGDTLFFTADDGVHGRELWKSDGTSPGTVLVRNINRNDDARRPGSRPSWLVAVGDTLLFAADDGRHGRELWRSDGSRAGTVLVKNIHPTRSADPYELTRVGGEVFFTADDGTHGFDLWKTDGSRAGTVLVKDVAPPSVENYYGSPHNLTRQGKRLFFAANDGRHGVELWKSNGRRTGTVMVKNIDTNERNDDPDYPGAMPEELTAMRGRLYFVAGDDTHGWNLWKSDGSKAGTTLVKDIDPRRRYTPPRYLTRFGDQLFFSARDATHGRELWRSDGSRAGTVMVKNIEPSDAPGYHSGSNPAYLTPAGDRLFFVADDGITGEGLWKSDGSRAGTVLVKNLDFRPGDFGYLAPMESVGSRLFFTAADGTPGLGLWTSDGSPSGTVLVRDFDSCDDSHYPQESRPSQLTAVKDRLFFSGEDAAHGEELWMSDGTPDGTVLVKDIRVGTTP